MATISVKRYFSYDVGAPTLNGVAGSAITLLDACLVNGYNTKTIQSITRSGATATVNFATAHGYTSDQVVALSGIDQAEYNGEFRPFNVTSTSFDITVSGTPVSPATGAAITAKVAPLNWTKVFSGTNKAVYKSNMSAFGCLYLRVDDTGATIANCRGYETMSDVDTGTGPFPTVTQASNGCSFQKSSTANSSAASWRLFGDEGLFYLLSGGGSGNVNPAWTYNGSYGLSFWFGDPVLVKSGDLYGTSIYGGNGTSGSGIEQNTLSTGHFTARAITQSGAAIISQRAQSFYFSGIATSGGGGLTYPAPDGSLVLGGKWFLQDSNQLIRGIYPGCYHIPHSAPVPDKTVLTGIPDLPGRSIFISATWFGGVAFDITGPWR